MQKIKNISYRIILCMFYWAILSNTCLGKIFTQQDSTTEIIEIRIDPTAALGGVDTMLFDSIAYIVLETNKQSQFSTISQLEVTEDYYIVLDGSLNALFFFNHDGSFSHKIDRNNENTPFIALRQFSVDRFRGILSFEDKMTPYIYTFELDGDLLGVEERAYFFRDFTLLNGFKIGYLPQNDDNSSDSSHFISLIRYDAATGRSLGSYLSVDSTRKNFRKLPSSNSPKNFYQSNAGHLLFTHPYDYTIYEFDSVAVPHDRYKVILPLANTIPSDFLSNPTYHGKWLDYLKMNRTLIYSIQDVYLSGDWLAFYTTPSIQGSAFLYNLATHELFNLKKTEDSSLGLPVTEPLKPVLGVCNGALISEVPFVSLKKRYEDIQKTSQNDIFTQNLKPLIKRESHNPVLRLSYLK